MAELNKEDIILKNKIAQRIQELRLSTGLSQTEFAEKHEIDRQTVNRWESKKASRGVTIYTINKFCRMLDMNLQDFFSTDDFRG